MPRTVPSVTQQLFDTLAPQRTQQEPTKQLGKEDFLKLLTLQLRSQNPLNPTSNQEMAAQLAQFSALEQMQNIRASLDKLLQSNASLVLSIAQYSAPSLIGRTAVVNTSHVTFDGASPVQLGYELPSAAAQVIIEIRSRSGALLRTLRAPSTELSQGTHTVEWDGRDDSGNAVSPGTYSIAIRALDAEGKNIAASSLVRDRITGIRYTSDGLNVLLGTLEVPISAIVELR